MAENPSPFQSAVAAGERLVPPPPLPLPPVIPTAPPNELLIAATLTAGYWAGDSERTMKDYLQTFDRFIREVKVRSFGG